MTTIRIQALPKFPASVEAGDGMVITRGAGVFTFAIDGDFFDGTYAKLAAATTFTAVQTITVAGNVAQLNLLSGSASALGQLSVGRTGLDLQLGVAGISNHYFTGTTSGDAALRSVSGSMFLGSGSFLGIKIGATGTLRFPQYGGGALQSDISGNITSSRVELGNFVQGSGLSVLGIAGGSTADYAAITAASDKQVLRRLGTTVGFGSIDLGDTAVTGASRLQLGNVVQGSARSVLGVTGNVTADYAAIQGTANQVLCVNSAGTAVTFGGINLTAAAAVNGSLGLANGGHGGTDAATGRSGLGLGTAAVKNTGTSGNTVPLLDGANTFSAAQAITTGSGVAGLTILSGGAGNLSDIVIGRTVGELQLGVAAASDQFLTGTVAGDVVLRASNGGALWLGGAGATYGIKIMNAGAVAVRGTTTNDNAAAGFVGELIESEILVGSAVPQTTGTSVNITSVSLTAGDWDVFGSYFTNMAGGTTPTGFEVAIHTVSATLPTRPNKGAGVMMNCSGVGQNYGMPVGRKRLSLSGTTTVYLVASASFTGSTLSGYGYLGARRVR